MPRRQPLTRPAAVAASVVALVVGTSALAGCGRTLSIEENLLGQPSASCAQVIVALPIEVGGHPARVIESDANNIAAWGDPPIVLTCGIDLPVAYEPTSTLADVSGISWLPEPLENGTLFTTIGRNPRVQVAVPSWVQSPSSVLSELAPSLFTATQQQETP